MAAKPGNRLDDSINVLDPVQTDSVHVTIRLVMYRKGRYSYSHGWNMLSYNTGGQESDQESPGGWEKGLWSDGPHRGRSATQSAVAASMDLIKRRKAVEC